jgi:hypothetical protein
MAYTVAGGGVETWFAAFNRDQNWKLQATKGASLDEIQKLMIAANS